MKQLVQVLHCIFNFALSNSTPWMMKICVITHHLVKYYLKEHEDLIQTLPNPIPIIEATLDGVTSYGWINDSGYT